MHTSKFLLVVVATAWCSASCTSDEPDIHAVARLDYGGRLERIETLGRYSMADAVLLFNLSGARSRVDAEHDYFLYRVTYPTSNVDGEPTRVSGLVAVPATRRIKGIVSWQHGTNTYQPQSISKPSIPEGVGVAAVFAANGFILTAADYIGLGVSREPQAYYHWPSTVSTVVDLLSIAEVMLDGVANAPDHDLYLAGFSQGGGATAALHRFLERENPTGLRLRASATIAAAFSPRWVSLANVIERSNTFHFAFVATSFARLYGGELDEMVKAPYSELLPTWFNGTKDGAFLEENLPSNIENLVTHQFLLDYHSGIERPEWFYAGLEAAETSDFAPLAPLRIHFGHKDTIVTPGEAHAAFGRMRALGGNVEQVDMGGYGHEDIVIATLPFVQQWFNAIEKSRPPENETP